MAETATNPEVQGAINTEVIDNAQETANSTQTATTTGAFVMTEENAWAILTRNDSASQPATYSAQVATVSTTSKGLPMVDERGNQYGIVNFRLQTPEQQAESEALMEAGKFEEAVNNTLNFRITPKEFGLYSRGMNANVTLGYVDSIRKGKTVLAVTGITPQQAIQAEVGRFADRRKALLEKKREAYLAEQAIKDNSVNPQQGETTEGNNNPEVNTTANVETPQVEQQEVPTA